ncbi:MAG: hypothetical protein LBR80_11805 [Deltaproteobacteria bacterium]|nr:hypothetical protein [Deltaproteobacteria bacterium]
MRPPRAPVALGRGRLLYVCRPADRAGKGRTGPTCGRLVPERAGPESLSPNLHGKPPERRWGRKKPEGRRDFRPRDAGPKRLDRRPLVIQLEDQDLAAWRPRVRPPGGPGPERPEAQAQSAWRLRGKPPGGPGQTI